jgi:hypothetical protein
LARIAFDGTNAIIVIPLCKDSQAEALMADEGLFENVPETPAGCGSKAAGEARMRELVRDQIELRAVDLDSLIAADHRDFTASPAPGTPQGLAVYQNGVRINESFGDVFNWAFIPEMAISRASLMPQQPDLWPQCHRRGPVDRNEERIHLSGQGGRSDHRLLRKAPSPGRARSGAARAAVPLPPPELAGDEISFTVPVFSIR